MSEPARSIEIERKYDVGPDAVLPDWSGLPGVTAVGDAEVRHLDARYFDTAAADLARARIALRRREGGPDAGWHVKLSGEAGREEWGWPLDASPDALTVPDAVVSAVARWAGPPLEPLARVRNTRTAYALVDGDGALVAEVVDDQVRASDEREGTDREWREWEVELGPAGPASDEDRATFFAAVDAAVTAAGGRPAASDSKLARALGR